MTAGRRLEAFEKNPLLKFYSHYTTVQPVSGRHLLVPIKLDNTYNIYNTFSGR